MTRNVPMGYLKKHQKSEIVEKPEMEMIARKWKKWKRKVTQKTLSIICQTQWVIFLKMSQLQKNAFKQTHTYIHTNTHTYAQKQTNTEREANNIANCPLEVKILGAL